MKCEDFLKKQEQGEAVFDFNADNVGPIIKQMGQVNVYHIIEREYWNAYPEDDKQLLLSDDILALQYSSKDYIYEKCEELTILVNLIDGAKLKRKKKSGSSGKKST